MTRKKLKKASLFLTVALLGAAMQVEANVVIGGTRIVYMSKDSDVSVRLTNDNNKPVLVQVWVDDGDMNAAPKDIRTPFTVPTPVFRMEPQKSQMVRLIFSGEIKPLPKDRESLFWLNTLEIPALSAEEKSKNILQMAFRNRIKIFYRPVELKERISSAPGELSLSSTGNKLKVINPTPYHVSFSSIEFAVDGKKYQHDGGGMVAPKSESEFTLKGSNNLNFSVGKINIGVLNDYGAVERYTGVIGKKLALVK